MGVFWERVLTLFPEGYHNHLPVHIVIEGIVAAKSNQRA